MSAFLYVDGVAKGKRKAKGHLKELPYHVDDTMDECEKTARMFLADFRFAELAILVVVVDATRNDYIDWLFDGDDFTNPPAGINARVLTDRRKRP